jgi:hypothetical protein
MTVLVAGTSVAVVGLGGAGDVMTVVIALTAMIVAVTGGGIPGMAGEMIGAGRTMAPTG